MYFIYARTQIDAQRERQTARSRDIPREPPLQPVHGETPLTSGLTWRCSRSWPLERSEWKQQLIHHPVTLLHVHVYVEYQYNPRSLLQLVGVGVGYILLYAVHLHELCTCIASMHALLGVVYTVSHVYMYICHLHPIVSTHGFTSSI